MDDVAVSMGVAFAAQFPIVDPVGNVPTFLSLTRRMDGVRRRSEALKSVAAALAILAVFLAIGNFILEYFGISLAAVEVIGGLVFGYMGWQMLFQSIEPPGLEQWSRGQRSTSRRWRSRCLPGRVRSPRCSPCPTAPTPGSTSRAS